MEIQSYSNEMNNEQISKFLFCSDEEKNCWLNYFTISRE